MSYDKFKPHLYSKEIVITKELMKDDLTRTYGAYRYKGKIYYRNYRRPIKNGFSILDISINNKIATMRSNEKL